MKRETQPDREPARDECVAMARLCLSMNLRKAERIVTRHYDAYLDGTGITAIHLPILAAITVLPQPGFRVLAEELELERSTLSRNLAALQQQGLVRIEPPSGPKPGMISLTRKGWLTLRRAHERWLEAHHALEESLSTKELSKGLAFLRTARRASPPKVQA